MTPSASELNPSSPTTGSKRIVVLVTLLTVLIGTIYGCVAPPLFRADSLIQIQGPLINRQTRNDDDTPIEEWFDLLDGEGGVVAEIETLRSRQVLGRVVEKLSLDLTVTPRYFPILGEVIVRQHDLRTGVAASPFGLYRYAWGGEHLQVDHLNIPSKYLGEELLLIAGTAGSYRLLEPHPRSLTGLGEWFDPKPQTLITGQVGETVQRDVDGERLTLSLSALTANPGTEFTLVRTTQQAAVEFLQRRLEVTEKPRGSGIVEIALQDSDPTRAAAIVNAIVDDYLRGNIERNAKKVEKLREILDEKQAALEKKCALLKAQWEVSTAALDHIRLERGLLEPAQEFQQLREQMAKVADQIKQIQQKREEAIRRFGPTHPTVGALDTRITYLTQDIAVLTQHLTSLSDTWQELTRRSREVEINTQRYLFLLNRTQAFSERSQNLLSAQGKIQELTSIPRVITLP